MCTFIVPVCTIPAEISPQALPLGAASIVAAINKSFAEKPLTSETVVEARLISIPPEFHLSQEDQAQAIAHQLLELHPVALCFSLFVWNRTVLARVAAIIQEKAPEIPLIAGGPEVTAGAADKDPFHYLVCGEGDESVPNLLRQLLQKVAFVANASKADSDLPQRKIFSPRANQENLPSPYLTGTLNPAEYQNGALWELARGCPFKCAYCYESKGEKTVAYFPMERIHQELDFFAKHKVSQIFVLDPTYNAKKERAVEILKLIRQKAPDTFFHFECRAELLNPELVAAFSRISCSLQIGLQSARPEVLKLVARNINRKEFAGKIALLNNAGIIFGFDLIYGLPGDNLAGFKESIDYAISLYPNSLEIFRLSVLPGTALFDQKQELGLVAPETPPYLVESTPQFSAKDLDKAEALARATSYFYSRGRAVSWFHSLLKPLRCSPSVFFSRFVDFLAAENINIPAIQDECSHQEVEQVQLKFIQNQYGSPKLKALLPAAIDLIKLNGAFSRAYADGERTTLSLSFHPDDLLSPYSQDLAFFCQHAKKTKLHIVVQPGKKGAEWRQVKKG
ncbi:MAG: B12-binding domain-containing radical SAM protein [Treponema sp.]|nr:B12-binding domain-containing radical SAM protein [Treponema sp.]